MNRPKREYRRNLRETFSNFPPDALDLLERMLTLDPEKRISASEALASKYFQNPPEPAKLWEYAFPWPSSHHLDFPNLKQVTNIKQRKDDRLIKDTTTRSASRDPKAPKALEDPSLLWGMTSPWVPEDILPTADGNRLSIWNNWRYWTVVCCHSTLKSKHLGSWSVGIVWEVLLRWRTTTFLSNSKLPWVFLTQWNES